MSWDDIGYLLVFIDVVGLSLWSVYLMIITPGFSHTAILLVSILAGVLIGIAGILIRHMRN